MKQIIQKIQSKPIVAILFILAVGGIVLFLSKISSDAVRSFIQSSDKSNFYSDNVLFKLFILLYSLGSILLLNKGNLKGYGFSIPKKVKYFKLLLQTAGLTIGSLLVGGIVFIFLMNTLFPTGNVQGFQKPSSLIQLILVVWIWSSLCEEVLVRGLIQGFIQNITKKKIAKLSIPILVSGLFFGAMHSMLFFSGMSLWFVCHIVFFATVLGTFAAYQREKTGSILPAFYVHFVGNVVGAIPMIVMLIIK
ncbi:MAG: CPBP family intramembrane metalloprotease [Salinivirgaceae bacterium]|nr:CPBP family intramembrane metalloprotease [Salinivirgaceae bacterium]